MNRCSSNKKLVTAFRLSAFIFITLGILDTAGIFSGTIRWQVFLTYTFQSNVLVWLFFAILIVKTLCGGNPEATEHPFAFYPVISFVISIYIFITMLIFWTILAPLSWSDGYLLTFSNFAVHLICPLLMIFDRIMLYPRGLIRKQDPPAILIFPLLHVVQSFVIGLNRLVYFAPIKIESYYIYPFLDYDKHGNMVFVYIFGLALFFLGLGYIWRHLETRIIAKK